MPAVLCHEDAQALAHKVVGDLVELFVSGDVESAGGADGIVDGVGKPRLEGGVEKGVQEDLLALVAVDVQGAVEPDGPLGDRPRLVGAQDVHAAEILDGGEPLHDDPLLCHPPCAMGEVDGDDRGEKLWGQPHGERHGEKEGLHDGPPEVDVEAEDDDDDEKGDLHEEKAEAAHTGLEVRLGRSDLEPLRNAAEFGCKPRVHDEGARRAADHMGPHEEGIGPRGKRGVGREDPFHLVDGECLARERRLVDEEILRREDQAVAGNGVAGPQQSDIARHNLLQGNLRLGPVAKHRGLDLDDLDELLHGIGGPPLLPEAQKAADPDDNEDDDGIGDIAEEKGEDGGKYEDQDDGARKLRKEQGRDVRAFFRLQEVFPVDCETACRFAFRQALCGALKRKNQLRGGNGPVPVGGVHDLRHPVSLLALH